MIQYLMSERSDLGDIAIPDDSEEQFLLYRSLVNIRSANDAPDEFLKEEDEFLQQRIAADGITDASLLTPTPSGLYLWQGDITRLRCDAIVNAANSGMTGCYRPCHTCIDNCIHTYAGVRLRLYCDEMMRIQGHEEPTGSAKITPAYNLPSRYVIHTVGPIVSGRLTQEHCRLLHSCYDSCLAAAVQHELRSIAFCCISTGVFGFPQKEAAQIAVEAAKDFRRLHDIQIIFNVFKDSDERIYRSLLSK